MQQRQYTVAPKLPMISIGCRRTSTVVISPWIAMATVPSRTFFPATHCHDRAKPRIGDCARLPGRLD
jgi:hypothetical protein